MSHHGLSSRGKLRAQELPKLPPDSLLVVGLVISPVPGWLLCVCAYIRPAFVCIFAQSLKLFC